MTPIPPVSRARVLVSRLWRWKWLVIVPVIVSALTSWLVVRFVPVRYQSSAILAVVPQQVPADYVHATVPTRDDFANMALSRTRLERLIADNDLYKDERGSFIMEEVVQHMRDDIEITSDGKGTAPGATIRVSYRSPDPRSAQKVTAALAGFIITSNMNAQANLSEGTVQFLDAQIAEAKKQVEAYESAHGQPARNESRAVAIEREAVEDNYRSLLLKRQDAKIAVNLQNRQYGEQLKMLDSPRIPERPVGLTRTQLSVAGTLGGLLLGATIVGVSSIRKRPSSAAERHDRIDA